MKTLLKFWVWTIFAGLPTLCAACICVQLVANARRDATIDTRVDISGMPEPEQVCAEQHLPTDCFK